MPTRDQLEIIDPQGRVRFYELDPARGLTNIGQHPDNDIVVDGPGVLAFHAVLDHRQKPYQLISLTQHAETLLDGQPVLADTAVALQNWGTIELGGHSIVFLEGQAPPAEAEPAPAEAEPGEPAQAQVPLGPPAPADLARANESTAPAAAAPPAAPPPRQPGPVEVEVAPREASVEPGETALFRVVAANGGAGAAAFEVRVEGLDPAWVTANPAQFNLAEGERASVELAVAPPRGPATRADRYAATVTVSSPDRPGWIGQAAIVINVGPFHEFSVGEVTPSEQTVYWSKPSAEAEVTILNQGSGEAVFRLGAEDERRGCRFEFRVPGDPVSQPRQAELRLGPGERQTVVVRVTPLARQLAGFGPRSHFFTVTVTSLKGQQMPRSVLGQVHQQPLAGRLALALTALIVLGLAVLLFRPGILEFAASPAQVTAGEEITLRWSAAPFSALRIDPDVGPVSGSTGSRAVVPKRDVTYTLTAENFLTWISPAWFGAEREVTVLVDPLLPSIHFTVDRDTVSEGGVVTLLWQVRNADELILTANGVPELIPPGQQVGSRQVVVNADTAFVLQARNRYTTQDGVSATLTVRVARPGATATPEAALPVIQRFEVSPAEVTAGGQVTLQWAVSGVDKVLIQPLPGEFPPVGSIVHTPQETTAYILSASNDQAPVRLLRQVVVLPAASGAAGTPRIDSFTATPGQVAPGSPESRAVRLAWSISGDVTNVEIRGPGIGTLSSQPPQGALTVSVDATATFTLTAYNGPLTSTQTVQVTVAAGVPQIASLIPASATAGGPAFTLVVNGASFVSGATVQWNGSPRTTTFVNSTQLTAGITAADIVNAGSATVAVVNPAPGGGTSNTQAMSINNPEPIITSIVPASAVAGGPAFTLEINGSGFNTQSIVRWNGSARTVTSVSPAQLRAAIPASDLASAGAVTINVVNPGPGGGSAAAIFTVTAATSTPTATATSTSTPTATPTATSTATATPTPTP